MNGESAYQVFYALARAAEANGFELPIRAIPVQPTTEGGRVFDEVREGMARQGAELPVAQQMPLLVRAGDLALTSF